MKTEDVKARTFISCPFDLLLQKYLPMVQRERINPEIGLNGGVLDRFRWTTFEKVARSLREAELCCTVHAPFTDLSMGAVDAKVRRVTRERLTRALDIAAHFGAASLVCHTGFDPRHYVNSEDLWGRHAVETALLLLERAARCGVPVALENVFEPTPETHRLLFEAVDSPLLGFCFDMGHQEVFSQSRMETWLDVLGGRLAQLHLHDNSGRHDEHLPIGSGILDFDRLFSLLHSTGRAPVITLEPHREEDIPPSLHALGRLLERYPLENRRILPQR